MARPRVLRRCRTEFEKEDEDAMGLVEANPETTSVSCETNMDANTAIPSRWAFLIPVSFGEVFTARRDGWVDSILEVSQEISGMAFCVCVLLQFGSSIPNGCFVSNILSFPCRKNCCHSVVSRIASASFALPSTGTKWV